MHDRKLSVADLEIAYGRISVSSVGELDFQNAGGGASRNGIFPNWDCDNTGGGERFMGDGKSPTVSTFEQPNPPSGLIPGTVRPFAPCFVAPDYPSRFGGTHFPHVTRDR